MQLEKDTILFILEYYMQINQDIVSSKKFFIVKSK